MIDDDLDRLLSDVGSGTDYSGSRDDTLRIKQRMARKSDVNIEGSGEGLPHRSRFCGADENALKSENDVLDYAKGVAQAVSTIRQEPSLP